MRQGRQDANKGGIDEPFTSVGKCGGHIPTEEFLRDCGKCLRIERQEMRVFTCQLPSIFG